MKLNLRGKEKFHGLSFAELGFIPRNKGLYDLALLHRSASKYTKSGAVLNYERLEFLGDAILGAIVAEILYKFFPKQDEGELTRLRSKIVSRESLNDIATRMGLDKEVVSRSDISKNKHIYGDVFEAFTGAIYLDQGYVKTKNFFEEYILPRYVNLQELVHVDKNYKSRLIEWGQKNKIELNITTVEAPRGRQAKFITTVTIDDKVMGKGVGSSKKEAEQNSAENAIRKIREKGRGRVDI
ncbi:MAG: ribonuclease III [Odoribacteraceae bacterium]|jgi:ribonuclease-3|nr:ribonuclease III [Odoribacteraceae bacterium]